MTNVANSSIQVLELGLACCAVEASSVDLVNDAMRQVTITADTEALSHILVVAGTITHPLAQTVVHAYESLAEPRAVIAFGVCAISGGPYWDSYSVVQGSNKLIPVDIMVPGCPPSPEDLARAIQSAIELVGS